MLGKSRGWHCFPFDLCWGVDTISVIIIPCGQLMLVVDYIQEYCRSKTLSEVFDACHALSHHWDQVLHTFIFLISCICRWKIRSAGFRSSLQYCRTLRRLWSQQPVPSKQAFLLWILGVHLSATQPMGSFSQKVLIST